MTHKASGNPAEIVAPDLPKPARGALAGADIGGLMEIL